MVTKPAYGYLQLNTGLILAKIHMVTKRNGEQSKKHKSLILAKIHMVTKLYYSYYLNRFGLILAKIHMVTKPQIHVTIYLKIIKY